APSPSPLRAWSSASEASSSSSSEDSGVAGCSFPSARASLHALSCLAFLFLLLSAFVSASSFRLFIFSAWRRLIRRCSGTGGLEGPHLNPCTTHPRWGQEKGTTRRTTPSNPTPTSEIG